MFAPEGYIRWVDMVRELDDWAERLILANYLHIRGGDPNDAFDERIYPDDVYINHLVRDLNIGANTDKQNVPSYNLALDEFFFTAEIIMNACLAKTLISTEPLICSTTGQIMRAPVWLLLHQDRLDLCYWQWPIRETSDFGGYFELYDSQKFPPGSISSRYCFIDPLTGIIMKKNNSESAFQQAFQYDATPHEISRMVKQVADPFCGYSIAWNDSNFPWQTLELLDEMAAIDAAWNLDKERILGKSKTQKRKARRGPKPTGARKEYFHRYPTGKPTNISYDAIAAELAEAGFPISSRQLQNYEKQRTNS